MILIHLLNFAHWFCNTEDITKWPLMLSRACMNPNSDFNTIPMQGQYYHDII